MTSPSSHVERRWPCATVVKTERPNDIGQARRPARLPASLTRLSPTMPTGTLPILAPLLLLLLLSAGSDAMAEERVLIRPEGTASQIAVRGKIVDYTGESVTILTGVGNVTKTYPIDSIVQVEMQRHPLHTEGAKLLAEGKINEATIALLQAHQQEPRQWVRREILALLVEAGLRSGDLASAASRFALWRAVRRISKWSPSTTWALRKTWRCC